MNIAWSTLILVLLSIPGFLFVFAFYTHSRSSRDATPKSQLAEFAIAIGIAFALHSIALLALLLAKQLWHAVPTIFSVFALFDPTSPHCSSPGSCHPAHILVENQWLVVCAIFYLFAMAGIGYGLGYGSIYFIERVCRLQVRFLHGWAHPFFLGKEEPRTFATAITDMRNGSAVVAYRGQIFEISLNRDRNVEVLVLKNATKTVFMIDEKSGNFSPPHDAAWRPITPPEIGLTGAGDLTDFLVINGNQILNLAMERQSAFDPQSVDIGDAVLDKKITTEKEVSFERAERRP